MAASANGATKAAQGVAIASSAGSASGAKARQRPAVVPVIPLALMQRRVATSTAASSAAAAAAKSAITTPTPTATVPSTPISTKASEPEPVHGIVSPLTSDEAAPMTPSALHTPTSIPATVATATNEDAGSVELSAASAEISIQEQPAGESSEAGTEPLQNGHVEAATPVETVAELEPEPKAEDDGDAKEAVPESTTPSSMESPPTNTTTPMPTEVAGSQPQAPPQTTHELAAAPAPHHAPHQHHQHHQQHQQHQHQQHQHHQHQQQHHNHQPEYHNHPHPHPHPVPGQPQQMQPFHPPPTARNGGMPRPTRLAPMAHMHTHSNGSSKGQFGNFPDSPAGPSPSPRPHFNGIAPPPGFPVMDNSYRHGYGAAPHHHGSLRQDTVADDISLHSAGYPPNTHPGYTAPHSLHGSLPPVHDDSAVYGQPSGPNGAPAPGPDARMAPPPGYPMAGMLPPHMMPAFPLDADGLREYIQAQCGETMFVDCHIYLSLPAVAREHATVFPGHVMIFARSPTLRELLHRRGHSSSHAINVVTDDKNIRVDAFHMAVRRLYGFDLFNPPTPAPAKGALGVLFDRFNYALGYAASGHLLRWEPITACGMEVAARHLDWPVLERALEFVLGSIPFRGAIDRDSQLPYGEPSVILIRGIVDFLVRGIPVNFVLDKTVADQDSYARIPNVSSSPISPREPLVARGSSIHRPGRLQNIKFGDMAPSPPGPQISPAIQLTLSRVLLNLPFIFLQPVLENFGMSAEWSNREARHQLVVDVLREREARRQRALEAVVEGRVPSAVGIQRGLQSLQSRALDEWDVLGWSEQISGINEATGVANLLRVWSPLRQPAYDDGTMFP